MIRVSISALLWEAENKLTLAINEPDHTALEVSLIESLNALIKAVKALLREAQ